MLPDISITKPTSYWTSAGHLLRATKS